MHSEKVHFFFALFHWITKQKNQKNVPEMNLIKMKNRKMTTNLNKIDSYFRSCDLYLFHDESIFFFCLLFLLKILLTLTLNKSTSNGKN